MCLFTGWWQDSGGVKACKRLSIGSELVCSHFCPILLARGLILESRGGNTLYHLMGGATMPHFKGLMIGRIRESRHSIPICEHGQSWIC